MQILSHANNSQQLMLRIQADFEGEKAQLNFRKHEYSPRRTPRNITRYQVTGYITFAAGLRGWRSACDGEEELG